MTISQIHQLFLANHSICTDTRKIKKNDIFFALKGDNFNGNSYAKKAIELGASYAIIDESEFKTSDQHILVNDALETLQQLASYHRNYLKIPIIALTGSNGKTTTKELINSVLSTSFNTTATEGNLNNHIGVPLTLLSMSKETEIGIVEMGANHQKEIETLCNIANPDYGYITNIGKAHLEGFGSVEGVFKGKTELYLHLNKTNKLVFSNLDDPKLSKATQGIKTYSFSQTNNKSDTNISIKAVSPNVVISYNNKTISSNLIGAYNFTNIAAAIAIGAHFKISFEKIKEGIESYTPTNNRSQILNKGNQTIILDAYNANPSSMEAAINNLIKLNHPNKTVFLGDMFELGKDAKVEHQKIAKLICNSSEIDKIYLIGENFLQVETTDVRVQKFKSFEDLSSNWELLKGANQILIKGSRGMKLERILDLF